MKFKFVSNNKDEAHEDIKNIYTDDEGTPVDMTTLDKGPRGRRFLIWMVSLLVAAIAIGVAGWFVFNRTPGTEGEPVLTVEAPAEVGSGDTVEITITYKNEESVDWKSADLSIRTPNGFYLTDTSPSANGDTDSEWELGEIRSGEGGTVHLRGQIVGGVGDTREFFAILSYVPENFQYDFQTNASASVEVTSSTITAGIDLPTRASSQDEIEYKITLLNESDLTIPKVKAELELPENFEIISEDPDPSRDLLWEFEEWDSTEPQVITITGKLSAEDGDTQEFGLRVSIVNEDGTETRQVEAFSVVQLVNPELNITAEIDGSTEDAVVVPGDEGILELTLLNSSDLVMRDVQVEIQATEDGSDGEITILEEIFPQTLDSSKYEDLGELLPNDEVKLAVPFTVLEELTGENLQVIFGVAVIHATIDDKEIEDGLPTDLMTAKIKTELTFSGEARYYNDAAEAIGSGPLPPTVGKTTTFFIFWEATNTSNEASTFSVTTVLPSGVTFEGEDLVDKGTLKYDSLTREITWKVKHFEPNTENGASFSISVTPKTSDIDTLLVLTKVMEVEAEDQWTDSTLTDAQEGLTSDLDFDEVGQGRGLVIAEEETPPDDEEVDEDEEVAEDA